VSTADDEVRALSSAIASRVRNSFSLSSAANASLVYPSSIYRDTETNKTLKIQLL